MIQRTCVRCSRPLPPIGADLLRGCVECRIEIRARHPHQWDDDGAWAFSVWAFGAFRFRRCDLIDRDATSGFTAFPPHFSDHARWSALHPNGAATFLSDVLIDRGPEAANAAICAWFAECTREVHEDQCHEVQCQGCGGDPGCTCGLRRAGQTESLAPFFRHIEQWLFQIECGERESEEGR